MKYSTGFIEYIRRLPFVRLLVPLLGGIVAEELVFRQKVNLLPVLVIFSFCFTVMFFVRIGKSYGYRWLWGVLIFCNLFLFGAEIMKNRCRQTTLMSGKQTFFRSVIIEKPDADARFTKLTLKITAYRDSAKNWIAVDEKAMAYLPADGISNTLKLGDVLMLNTTFSANSSPGNPEEFNYSYYLARRNFFASTFVTANNYKKTGHENLWFRKAILNIQTAMFDCFSKTGIEGDNFAVLRALIIGDKDLLSDEIVSAYSVAGAMHVLAVSGLHVGLVYSVLFFLLSIVNKRRFGKFIRIGLVFFGIWLYAALAAFSPSVCRACVMFSFVLFGDLFGKKVNIYNSLAASAFFLSLVNPYNIFEVGFQLSYCSVIAIVYFQPLIYKTIYIRNKILKYIFALAAVSIAAQIGTLPITIFYFHTFPNYFLITNVLIIPLVTVIMFTVAATLIVSWVPLVGILTGKFLDISVSIANSITKNIEMLPYSLSENIYMDISQVCILIAAFIFLAFNIAFGNKKALIAVFCCFVIFCGMISLHEIERQNRLQMTVYNTKGSSFISFVEGQNSINIRDRENIINNFAFNTKNHFVRLGIKNTKTIAISNDIKTSGIIKSYKNIILFGNKSIKIATGNDISPSSKPLKIDFLIVNKYLGNNIQQLLNNYHPKILIIDSSIPARQAGRWITEAEKRNISHHYVGSKGAFIWTRQKN
ncbi:MAG: ComEC family competence protein [Prevotellaceae bacterium]|nr:ComEC family competence protein [Prevotellaceae bacterium]